MAELVTVEKAARALHLNKYFMYREAAAGKLPHYRQGRAIRFDVDELRGWMREQAMGQVETKDEVKNG